MKKAAPGKPAKPDAGVYFGDVEVHRIVRDRNIERPVHHAFRREPTIVIVRHGKRS